IPAREIELGVLGNDDTIASIPGEILPGNEFYDYEAKYFDGKSQLVIPANVTEEERERLQEFAIRAFKAIDGAGLARVDFFIHKGTGKILVNEINTMPGFTPYSMYPLLWQHSGIPYGELIDRLIDLALQRYEEGKSI
ncbi:MAG: ATP-grasp domain-containing protein, partial [Thermicanus sp.]|nr:ATP-grasp domain-containing protein [Thermicanus sp.]